LTENIEFKLFLIFQLCFNTDITNWRFKSSGMVMPCWMIIITCTLE